MKGDGRAKAAKKRDGQSGGPAAQLWTIDPLEKVAAAFGKQLKGRDRLVIEIPAAAAYQALTEAGIPLQSRNGKKSVIDTIVAAAGGAVTHKEQESDKDHCYLCVTAGDSPPSDSKKRGLRLEDLAAPAPIYLPGVI